jgi:hypothetical protein
MKSQDEIQFEDNRNNARNFGGGVYVGGVIAATMLFITFVLTAFPKDAYFSRVIMTGAGLAVGASMLAFPYALHNWAFEKKHRKTTVILYYLEMLFIAINTIVSFVNLLAVVTGYNAPAWAILYEPFSIVSIIYVIFAWGTIFLSDPQSKTKQAEREYDETFKQEVARVKLDFLQSQQGREAIAEAAKREINEASASSLADDFFQTVTTSRKEATTSSPKLSASQDDEDQS